MKLSLVVMTAGKLQGQSVPINLPQFIIGRDPQCNLRPGSAVISKRHCAILVKDGKISVRDFDSTNGTFVNDVPVKGEAALAHDDILKIGPLEFRVKVEGAAPAAKPTPLPARSETVGPATKPPATPGAAKPTPTPAGTKPAAGKPAAAKAAPATPANTTPAITIPPVTAPAVATPAATTSAAAKKDAATPAATEDHSDDESVAAMLLSLQEDGEQTPGEESGGESSVPEGSTVMDMAVTPPNATPAPTPASGNAKTPTKKPDSKNDPAHLAAKAILDKYNRRSRG